MDYEILRFLWWVLVGVLLIGFIIMSGQDLGVGILSPFVASNDDERRVAINTVAPHWDGNQVWLITGGGAIFAAWPLIYAAAFSGFYLAMLAVLWTIFLRPAAFEYRSKISNINWRKKWDFLLFIGSFVPVVVFGVAFGNLLQGVPFYIDPNTLNPYYTGSFFALLNPFALLCGVISLAMVVTHGASFLFLRTDSNIRMKSKKIAICFGLITTVCFAVAGMFVAHLNGYVATNLLHDGPSNPFFKQVHLIPGGWLLNYYHHPITLIAPICGLLGELLVVLAIIYNRAWLAIIYSSIGIAGIIMTVGISMFPFLMPSSTDLNSSLTLWDCTSSYHTLKLMLIAALVFTPIVLIYTTWAYRIMRGTVTTKKIRDGDHELY